MSEDAVRFDGVVKRYGDVVALSGLTARVPRGSVTTILGKNGAGKTTALRCLMGLVRADAGRVFAFGQDVTEMTERDRARVGYVSEKTGLDPRLTVGQTLDFARAFYPSWDDSLARDLMERLSLSRSQPLSGLSLGQGRKVALLVNLAFRPELLVLDEPAANLDVVVRREFLEVVVEMLHAQGLTVLISTHLLTDVERIADRVVLIEDGHLRVESDLDELKERVRLIRLIPRNGTPVPDVPIDGLLRKRRAGDDLLLYVDDYEPGMEERFAAISGARAEVRHLPLEDIFIAYESTQRVGGDA